MVFLRLRRARRGAHRRAPGLPEYSHVKPRWSLPLVLILLAGCAFSRTQTPPATEALPTPAVSTPVPQNPEGTAAAFLDAWEKQDHAGMYSLLTRLTQDALTLEEFNDRYTQVADTARLTAVDTQILSSLQNGESAEVSYSVTLHSAVVGDITRDTQLTLKLESGQWRVAWTDGSILPELAGGNTLAMEDVLPARANIYDRNGLALAAQSDVVSIGVVPGQITDEPALLNALSQVLGETPEAIKSRYEFYLPDWYAPIGETLAENLPRLDGISGLRLSTSQTRYYFQEGVASHVVGFMGPIPADRLDEYKARGYRGDESVGVTGLEGWAESYLAGVRGGTLRAVTPGGQVAATLAESQTQPAQAVYTTIDRALQLQVQDALGDFPGAVVVLDKNTGEVLALASNPKFDPNLFNPTNYNARYAPNVYADGRQPMLNRATQGQYPLGSVFKIITMAAALESGTYTRDTIYTCNGYFTELGIQMQDWTVAKELPPHGAQTLVEGLMHSCNPYFWHVGYDLFRIDPFLVPKMARAFGLGEATGIDQVVEIPGLIPDPDWKLATRGEPWRAGDSVNIAVGQGDVLVTPLQVARFIAAIGNDGTLYRPQLVKAIVPPGGEPTYEMTPEVQGRLPLSAGAMQAIQDGMIGVVTNPTGTARHRFRGLNLPVAGKTGTAEDPPRNPHAWFAGYTFANNADKPDIAVVVLVQNKGEGSEYAAPIFRRVVESYFFGRPNTLYPWESEFGVVLTPTETPTATPEGFVPTETPAPEGEAPTETPAP